MSFNCETGEDLKRAPYSNEDCTKSCYDCLLSYGNQIFHKKLDRHTIVDYLMLLKDSELDYSSVEKTTDDHFAELLNKCDSDLEKEWIKTLKDYKLQLPAFAQKTIEKCSAKPDFLYISNDLSVAVYIDGPPHDFPDRRLRDEIARECL